MSNALTNFQTIPWFREGFSFTGSVVEAASGGQNMRLLAVQQPTGHSSATGRQPFCFRPCKHSARYSDAHSFYSGVVAVAKIAPTHEKSIFLRRVILITYSRTNFRPFNSLMHNIIGFSKE